VAVAVLEIQPTPNPNAMKFVLDRSLFSEPASFYSPAEAQTNPLAAKLMAVIGVTHIMLLGDFVTIGKQPQARWSEISGRVKKILADI
jgi:hypothetical protein